ncbi:MAG: ABC transporter substrate-binding protein [Acidimicrobiales bacterium]
MLVLGLVAAACGSSGDDTGTASTEGATGGTSATGGDGAAAPEGDPIVLGGVLPFSGPQASTGELGQQGADLAVKLINAKGGVLGRPLEIEYKDTQAIADEDVAKVREFHEEGVDLTFGYTTSSGCLAVAPIADQLEMVMLSAYCQTNKATGENFSEAFFRATTNAEIITRSLAKAMQEREPQATQWVSISPDYEYGHNTVTVFKNEMGAEVDGFAMLAETWPPFQSPTYNDYITQVSNEPAQGVFSSLYAGDMLNMLKQQKPFGLLEGKVFATIGMDLDVIGPMAASGDLPPTWDAIVYYAPAFSNPANDEFVAAFNEEYGIDPTFYPATNYIAVLAYAAAIEKAGSAEPAAVREALKGLTFDTPLGSTTIRAEDHQAVFESIAVIKLEPTDGGGYEVADTVLVTGDDVTSPPNPGEQNPFDVES